MLRQSVLGLSKIAGCKYARFCTGAVPDDLRSEISWQTTVESSSSNANDPTGMIDEYFS